MARMLYTEPSESCWSIKRRYTSRRSSGGRIRKPEAIGGLEVSDSRENAIELGERIGDSIAMEKEEDYGGAGRTLAGA
jgi:hypothetical protein